MKQFDAEFLVQKAKTKCAISHKVDIRTNKNYLFIDSSKSSK